MNDESHTNALVHETSPYLLQHAHNPVDWNPWNDMVLAKAREEDKPILLSIGYSACHWCHVMAHESFEDADTAALMNRLFVNIKVDREERPDLDRVYQLAHQVLAQRGGGWPLTMFLAPDDLTPFFAGTYFPRAPRYGMPGFKEVLTRVAGFYREHRSELRQQNTALQNAVLRIAGETAAPAGELTGAPLQTAYRSLSESFDPRYGGFGRAPKFPHAPGLEFLLWRAADAHTDAQSASHSRTMLETTLTRMAQGGLYDQLGGGFCRYSTDAEWMIPHFEKMLYDNGPLLALYAQTAKFSGDGFYAEIAQQTAEWVMTEIQAPQGGYYSSLDADSEGHEGKYYVWDKEEIRALLTADEYAIFAPHYGLDQAPNFEGHWHLHSQPASENTAMLPKESDASEHSSPSHLPMGGEGGRHKAAGEGRSLLKSACSKLLAARRKRVRPGLDDKVLTAWNGLMIRGMALAGRLLEEPRFVESARLATGFVRTHLCKNGRLLASWRDDRAKLPAYLDDYAFTLDGVLELVQAHWDSDLFAFVRQTADGLLALFEDQAHGGFWFTANDQEIPLYRPKTFGDESLPSGNAVAARALLRLGHLCAEPRYLDAAERTLRAALPAMNPYPEAHASMLLALQDALAPPTMVVVRGKADKLRAWNKQLDRKFDPRRIILAIPDNISDLTGLLAQCTPRRDVCAYVCRGTQCSLPIQTFEALSLL
ncbi:MAG: thioredoxin domain-containing protein [Gammaproteobacteria bacterium]|nr:thioredoxin domain-containing protein [Gammaproteobacteria bacterium]